MSSAVMPTGAEAARSTRAAFPVSENPPEGKLPAEMQFGRRNILLVEDEESITVPLSEALQREGFEPQVAGTAAEALELAKSTDPDLVLLDVMLPDGSGFDVCRELRARSRTPIIMLTARGDEADRVAGLEAGADDYIVKPFSAREVAARIRAVLRRSSPEPEPTGGPLRVGDVTLDPASHEAAVDGRELDLSRKEFDVLRLLMENAGTVVKRERLLEEVWETNWFGSTKTLDVHVSALRRKLGDDTAEPKYIHTVRGVGFRFAAPEVT